MTDGGYTKEEAWNMQLQGRLNKALQVNSELRETLGGYARRLDDIAYDINSAQPGWIAEDIRVLLERTK